MEIEQLINIKYPSAVGLKRYLQRIGVVKPEELTNVSIHTMKQMMKGEIAVSSVHTYIRQLLSVVNAFKSEFINVGDTDNILTGLKRRESTHIYLNKTDIDRLCSCQKNITKNELLVRSALITACYTGARLSDLTRICYDRDYNELTSDSRFNGLRTISFVTQKTGKKVTIPLSDKATEAICTIRELAQYGQDLRALSRVCYDSACKSVCRRSGIDNTVQVFKNGELIEGPKFKFVSSHTARRSFATNLYLSGASIYDIQKLMGHTSIEMTKNYICSDEVNLTPETLGFFN